MVGMPPAAKKHPHLRVPYVPMTATAITTVNGKTYKKELTATQSAGPRGPVQGKYTEKTPIIPVVHSNFSNYNHAGNLCWDGTHNDYLFMHVDTMA